MCNMCEIGTGWQKCIGCLKLQVSFCRNATNNRALLRKMTYSRVVKKYVHIQHIVICLHRCHAYMSFVTYMRYISVILVF